VGHVGSRLRALWRDPWQSGGFRDEGTALLHYALFAAALCAWLASLGIRRVVLTATATGVAMAVALEATQLMIQSRMPGALDALVRTAGVLAGAALWATGRRSRSSMGWMCLLIVATAASAATQMLSPFEVADVRRPFGWLPFMGYYENNWFPAVSHVIELTLLYFPLGFCIGWVLGRPRLAAAAALGVTLLVCAPIEYFQGWIVGRYPDITDVAFSFAGAWLGTVVSIRGAEAFERTLADARDRAQVRTQVI
jgi:VanZ family protein